MKEFIEKLIEKLNDRMEHLDSRHKILTDAGLFKESDKIAYKMVEVDFIKQIVNELAEEYNNDFCEWEQDDKEIDVYYTKCGQAHIFIDGNPDENNHVYCPYCGKKIKIAPYQPKGE